MLIAELDRVSYKCCFTPDPRIKLRSFVQIFEVGIKYLVAYAYLHDILEGIMSRKLLLMPLGNSKD